MCDQAYIVQARVAWGALPSLRTPEQGPQGIWAGPELLQATPPV